MADGPLVQISIGGAPLAIMDGQIYALLMPDMAEPVSWAVSSAGDGTIQFTDQASGRLLSAPGTDPGTQATATVPKVFTPVGSWSLALLDDSGDPQPIKEPSQIASGYYTVQAPGTGNYLSRRQIEDYSLRPKQVVLAEADSDARWQLIIQVV